MVVGAFPRSGVLIESLESRQLFAGTLVDINTNIGVIQVEMFDEATPATVANFLNYVNNGRYNNTVVHRAIDGFVVQLGGYDFSTGELQSIGPFVKNGQQITSVALDLPFYDHIAVFDPVVNEFSSSPRDGQDRVNVRGTLAMAKTGGNPDSATSEFFFNLSDDNASNLDNQNGGFTTFARVVRGMDIVDKMVAVSATPTADEFIPYYGVLSGASPDYVNANMPLRGYEYDNGLPTAAQAVVINSVNVNFNVGDGGYKSLSFVDADGSKVTTSLKRGTAALTFTGSNIQIVPGSGGTATVTGTNLALSGLNLNGTDPSSVLTVTASGGTDKATTIGSITVDSSIGTINATRATLTGNLNVTGYAKSVSLLGLSGGTLNVGMLQDQTDPKFSLKVGSVVDGGINAAGAIKSITASSWTSSNATVELISATTIGTISVKGDFAPSVTTTAGGVTTAAITGDISSAEWDIAGSVATLKAGSWNNAQGVGALTAGSLGKIVTSGNFGPDVTTSTGGITSATVGASISSGTWDITGGALSVTAKNTLLGWTAVFDGAIGTMSVKETLDGALVAGSIRTLKATTLSAPVKVTATDGYALTTVSLNTMLDAEIRSAGDIKSISVKKGVFRSGIYVSVAGDALEATVPGDFADATKRIVSATFTNAKGQVGFQDSALVAPNFGKVSLGMITDVASASPFNGTASDAFTSLAFILDNKKIKIDNPADTASATAQMQSDGVNPQNFVVRVV